MRKFRAVEGAVSDFRRRFRRSGAVLAHFLVAVAHDRLGFLLIELGEFRTGVAIDTQQLVELGVQGQIVAPVSSLDKQRHREYRERRHRVPVEGGPIEHKPQHGVQRDDQEGGGMTRRLPDMRRPMSFGRLGHRVYYRITFPIQWEDRVSKDRMTEEQLAADQPKKSPAAAGDRQCVNLSKQQDQDNQGNRDSDQPKKNGHELFLSWLQINEPCDARFRP
jgi:hypothetical protein